MRDISLMPPHPKAIGAIAPSLRVRRGYATAKIDPTRLEEYHRIAFLIVTGLAILTRFYGLGHPSEVVFDESHMLRFISAYLSRRYFVDLHPPLGRLIYTLIAWLFGYDGKLTSYDIGESYIAHGVPHLALRSLPALLSSLTVSVIYLIMWESGYGIPACAVAAGLVLLDTAQIAQTRLIYLDAILCFSIACSLLFYIKFSKLRDQPLSKRWWTWLLLTGFALSCSISTKYVGLFTFLTIGTYVIIDLWELFNIKSGRASSMPDFAKHLLARAFALVVFPFVLYLLWFQIHFAILTRSGDGDEFMSEGFLETLNSNSTSKQGVKSLSFFRKWVELQMVMLEENSYVSRGHPYESRPHQWPFSAGGVSFWCSDETREQIYFVGNLAGWWIATCSLAVFAIVIITDQLCRAREMNLLRPRTRSRLYKFGSLFFLTWALHYFPFYFMSRQLMLHTYLPAHLASTMVAGSLVDLLDSKAADKPPVIKTTASEKDSGDEQASQPKDTSASRPRQTHGLFAGSSMAAWIACGGVLLAAFAFWCFWLPLTYGYPSLSVKAVLRRGVIGRLQYAR